MIANNVHMATFLLNDALDGSVYFILFLPFGLISEQDSAMWKHLCFKDLAIQSMWTLENEAHEF